MSQTLTLVPSTGSGALTPDTTPGWSWNPAEHPSDLELFTDSQSLVHLALGGLLVQFGPIPAVMGSLAFISYQLSQVTEPMARTAGEIMELSIGMLIGFLLRGKS